jgi:acid phosphatase type 7
LKHRPLYSAKTLLTFLLFLFYCLQALNAQIAVISDTQGHEDVFSQVVSLVSEHHPQAVIHLGDLTAHGKDQQEYDNFFKTAKQLLNSLLFFPVRGNHDKDAALFLAYFPNLMDRTYYSVSYDSLKFIIIDTNLDLMPRSEQYSWLEKQLGDDSNLPRIVLMHIPVFSSGYHGSNNDLGLFLPALFQQYHVAAVLSGHDHDYERLEFNGIPYIISGGAGGMIRPPRELLPFSKHFANIHNFLILQREGKALDCAAYDLDGKLIDSCLIDLR